MGVFNQRIDYRVEVESRKAVPVVLTTVKGAQEIGFNGHLKDVSVGGAGFFIRRRPDRERASLLKVDFRLPSSEECMAFVCRAWHWHHNRLLGIYCCVTFDTDRTEDISRYREILQEYVDGRLLTSSPR